jgi:hypothetical protein
MSNARLRICIERVSKIDLRGELELLPGWS